MRTRTTDDRYEVPGIVRQDYNLDGTPYLEPVLVTYPNLVGQFKQIVDEPHPGYRTMRRDGVVVLGNACIETWNSEPLGTVTGQIGPHPDWGTRKFTGSAAGLIADCVYPDTSVLFEQLEDYRSIVLTNCMAQAHESGILALEVLSSLDDTVRMIRRPLAGAADLVKRMTKIRKRRIGKTTASVIRASSDAWLECRYGWKPLFSDMFSCMLKAEDGLRKKREIRVARAGTSLEGTFSKTGTVPDELNNFKFVLTGTCVTDVKVKIAGGVIFRITLRNRGADLQGFMGSRPSDLPSSIWEIIPYSFVVDWFVNVGSWIRAYTPEPSVEILGNWISDVATTTKTITSTWSRTLYNPTVTYTGSAGSEVRKDRTLTRRVNVPATPELIVNPNITRLRSLDGAALLVGEIQRSLTLFRTVEPRPVTPVAAPRRRR